MTGKNSRNGDYDPLVTRLDALLRLMLERQREADDSITVGDQILTLEDCGLSPSESGSILGVESNQIPSYLRSAKNQKLRAKLSKKKGQSSSNTGEETSDNQGVNGKLPENVPDFQKLG